VVDFTKPATCDACPHRGGGRCLLDPTEPFFVSDPWDAPGRCPRINAFRAYQAHRAWQAFEPDEVEFGIDSLTDLLTNFLHLQHLNGHHDPARTMRIALDRAERHYVAERRGARAETAPAAAARLAYLARCCWECEMDAAAAASEATTLLRRFDGFGCPRCGWLQADVMASRRKAKDFWGLSVRCQSKKCLDWADGEPTEVLKLAFWVARHSFVVEPQRDELRGSDYDETRFVACAPHEAEQWALLARRMEGDEIELVGDFPERDDAFAVARAFGWKEGEEK